MTETKVTINDVNVVKKKISTAQKIKQTHPATDILYYFLTSVVIAGLLSIAFFALYFTRNRAEADQQAVDHPRIESVEHGKQVEYLPQPQVFSDSDDEDIKRALKESKLEEIERQRKELQHYNDMRDIKVETEYKEEYELDSDDNEILPGINETGGLNIDESSNEDSSSSSD